MSQPVMVNVNGRPEPLHYEFRGFSFPLPPDNRKGKVTKARTTTRRAKAFRGNHLIRPIK